MKHKKQMTCLVLLFLGLGGLQAQDAVTAAGGEASGSGGSSSYSVGQVLYTTSAGSNGIVAHGVQQAYEIFVTTGIEETNINLELSVYPNPTTNYLNLKVEDPDKLIYQLYDLQGRMLANAEVISNSTRINLEDQPSSTYFLVVLKENNIIKTFKVIKP